LNVTNPKTVETALRETARSQSIAVASVKPIAASLEDVFASLEKEMGTGD
jgi:hypothetical protein